MPELNRGVSRQEYLKAAKWAREAGLENVHLQ